MTVIKSLTTVRLVGLVVLASAAMPALPRVLHADPVPAPAAAPTQPLTVPRPDAAARRQANRERILDARLEQLHAGLQLTPTQQPLWRPVADAIGGFVEARGFHFRRQLEAASNSIDGLAMQGDHMAKVGVAMSRLAAATKPLVASLTPDQKSRLPMLLDRVRPRKVIARAFEVPLDTDSSVQRGTAAGVGGAAGVAPNALPAAAPSAASPSKPSGDAGAMSRPKQDPTTNDGDE